MPGGHHVRINLHLRIYIHLCTDTGSLSPFFLHHFRTHLSLKKMFLTHMWRHTCTSTVKGTKPFSKLHSRGMVFTRHMGSRADSVTRGDNTYTLTYTCEYMYTHAQTQVSSLPILSITFEHISLSKKKTSLTHMWRRTCTPTVKGTKPFSKLHS